MAAEFLHDEAGVEEIVSNMKSALSDYSETVSSLESVITEISSSGDWQDEDVKTSFVNTATSYLEAFKLYKDGMEKFINVLELKSGDFASCEDTFSR